jgi:hypothetical protein
MYRALHHKFLRSSVYFRRYSAPWTSLFRTEKLVTNLIAADAHESSTFLLASSPVLPSILGELDQGQGFEPASNLYIYEHVPGDP